MLIKSFRRLTIGHPFSHHHIHPLGNVGVKLVTRTVLHHDDPVWKMNRRVGYGILCKKELRISKKIVLKAQQNGIAIELHVVVRLKWQQQYSFSVHETER